VEHITVGKIVDVVADHYGLTLAEMYGPGRARSLSHPRQMAMYLARKRTGASLPQIAKYLRRADHTTIMHGIKVFEDRIKHGTQKKDLQQVEERLAQTPPMETINVTGYSAVSLKMSYKIKLPKPPAKPYVAKPRTCLACQNEFLPRHKHQFMCLDKQCLRKRRAA